MVEQADVDDGVDERQKGVTEMTVSALVSSI